jgi:hypothetical protein
MASLVHGGKYLLITRLNHSNHECNNMYHRQNNPYVRIFYIHHQIFLSFIKLPGKNIFSYNFETHKEF